MRDFSQRIFLRLSTRAWAREVGVREESRDRGKNLMADRPRLSIHTNSPDKSATYAPGSEFAVPAALRTPWLASLSRTTSFVDGGV